MGKELFGAASLATIDEGRVKAAIDRYITDVAADIEDRGQDGETRTITVTLNFKPLVNAGEVYEVQTEISAQAKVPPRRTKPYSMGLKRHRGGTALEFNEASSDNIRQGSLDDVKKS